MVCYPSGAGLVHGFNTDIGAGTGYILHKVSRGTARCGENNVACALAGNGGKLIEHMLGLPLKLLARAADKHQRFAFLDIRARLNAVDSAVGQEYATAGNSTLRHIMTGHNAEVEEASRQTGTHTNHAQAALVASQTQGCKVRAVAGAKDKIRLRQIQILALVAKLRQPAHAGYGNFVAGMLSIRAFFASASQQSLRQTSCLREVASLTVADDVNDHIWRENLQN